MYLRKKFFLVQNSPFWQKYFTSEITSFPEYFVKKQTKQKIKKLSHKNIIISVRRCLFSSQKEKDVPLFYQEQEKPCLL